jgi:hypothetical protein
MVEGTYARSQRAGIGNHRPGDDNHEEDNGVKALRQRLLILTNTKAFARRGDSDNYAPYQKTITFSKALLATESCVAGFPGPGDCH